FTSTNDAASQPVTAIDDCVRGRALTVPARTPAQLRQWQFHCGNPPPAAEPSTVILIGFDSGREPRASPADAPSRHQRFAMYIVISMPNRRSIASGVSQRILPPPRIMATLASASMAAPGPRQEPARS